MPKQVDVKSSSVDTSAFKDMLMNTWEQEYQTTINLLKAYPEDQLDLRPHEKLRSARELAWEFTNGENWMIEGCLKGEFSMEPGPPPPSSMREIINNFESVHRDSVAKVRRMSDSDFNKSINFYVAPRTMGEIPFGELLSMMVRDQIHHRGQLSVYLRLANGKVPSIYGPTADESWM